MRVAVFGAEGQLGQDVLPTFGGHKVASVAHGQADVTDAKAVTAAVAAMKPDLVINAAAMTHVDRCETERERAFAINGEGAGNVARACGEAGATLIHISTDYVFDGKKGKPYVESDTPNPLNVYGESKLDGERRVAQSTAAHYIVRSSGLYGVHPCRGKGGANFVETMLRLAGERDTLKVVDDEVLTPTYTVDLARALIGIAESQPPYGIYHATNGGECSWFTFARRIFELAGVEIALERTTAASWGAPAKRPPYSVLANDALARAGVPPMPAWEGALGRYLAQRSRA